MIIMYNDRYYLVRGWYENTNGLNAGKFYGAAIDDSMNPVAVVLEGEKAVEASKLAANKSEVVYPSELSESVTGTDAVAIHPGASTMPSREGPDRIDGLKKNKKIPKKKRGERDPVNFAENKTEKPPMPHANSPGGRLNAASERVPPAKRKNP